MAKKLRIAEIAPLWIPVPPRTYGGIELMLAELTDELVRRGHEITLFASGESLTTAKLVPVTDKAIWLERNIRNPHASIIRLTKMVFDRLYDFDLIHNHFNFFPFPISLRLDCPSFLTTVHRPVDKHYAETMKAYSKIKFCAISENHKQSMVEQNVPVAGVIPNGIDISRYEYNENPDDYVLYLGRLNKEKGILTALEVAKSAGVKLVVAGSVVGGEETLFFLQEVQPHLNEEGVKFVGQAAFAEKIDLLKRAKALLFPIERREPFGLVMIEAMACGTPVIAFPNGSVPEIVENGKNGFIVNTKEEMIRAISQLASLDRRACRKAVEDRFTVRHMVDRYEELFLKII
ncbi:MAG: glycosyltransferase family 4 protein [Candidatus Sungbacteria bacterium]|nr:glycosyltransferase family 4 protein [Candidatus Sungbacteria bacterium]